MHKHLWIVAGYPLMALLGAAALSAGLAFGGAFSARCEEEVSTAAEFCYKGTCYRRYYIPYGHDIDEGFEVRERSQATLPRTI